MSIADYRINNVDGLKVKLRMKLKSLGLKDFSIKLHKRLGFIVTCDMDISQMDKQFEGIPIRFKQK